MFGTNERKAREWAKTAESYALKGKCRRALDAMESSLEFQVMGETKGEIDPHGDDGQQIIQRRIDAKDAFRQFCMVGGGLSGISKRTRKRKATKQRKATRRRARRR